MQADLLSDLQGQGCGGVQGGPLPGDAAQLHALGLLRPPIVHPNSILVVTINGIGLVIEAAYLTIFFIYSDSKKRVSAAILRIMLSPPLSIRSIWFRV